MADQSQEVVASEVSQTCDVIRASWLGGGACKVSVQILGTLPTCGLTRALEIQNLQTWDKALESVCLTNATVDLDGRASLGNSKVGWSQSLAAIQIWPLPCNCWVALGQRLNFSEPQTPHPYNVPNI